MSRFHNRSSNRCQIKRECLKDSSEGAKYEATEQRIVRIVKHYYRLAAKPQCETGAIFSTFLLDHEQPRVFAVARPQRTRKYAEFLSTGHKVTVDPKLNSSPKKLIALD
jgi:hypothetical protein